MKEKKMLIKFENKSNRVKGLAFHPTRPWILASLHNGVIQLWDYRMEVLVDTFEEHDGPVRGVHFHCSQPLFVSGGDDYKVKVWNYQLKRCLFTLLGHLDYIRTVQFHNEYPWIVSASDDQTVRIWNWQSRSCLQVLTGHNHYVMCAQFHPREDLVLSASLDQTARVWDVSGLRAKTVSIGGGMPGGYGGPGGMHGGRGQQQELFGASDVIVKHVLEGHSRGVNWASFHRSLNLIVTGADDREVKLWRMNDAKAWEVETMRGHINNVSCVLFHPKKELIISNSEDKSIRVWDIAKQQSPLTLRRDADRYWILDAHPRLDLLAAGHDSGLLVFKLNRERPPMCVNKKKLYYHKEGYVYERDLSSGGETVILSTRGQGRQGNGGDHTYRTLHYNQSNHSSHCLLLCNEAEGSYELYNFPKQRGQGDVQSALRGFGRSAVFVSRSRFAVLDKSRTIWLKSLSNETKRKISVPNMVVTHLFPGGVGRLLLRTHDAMVLYDIQSLKIIKELPLTSRHPVKYVVWSPNGKHVALMTKASIIVCNSKLEELGAVNENCRIKSGVFDTNGVFLYTTHTHVKYVLPNGDCGILRTLQDPVYLTGVSGDKLSFIDRARDVGELQIDTTEYLFKLALVKRRSREVIRLMKTKKLVGQAIISYLQKKGYPEVALHFVEDVQIKFNLALECGNIGVAMECAQALNKDESWHKLGVEALRQGNHKVVEAAYQKTKNFERLSFLYLITGMHEKLAKMLEIARMRQDRMARFHNALYLGDVGERVAVLREAGQLKLAWVTAKLHGLDSDVGEDGEENGGLCAEIEAELLAKDEEVPTLPQGAQQSASLLSPPVPILRCSGDVDSNWPLLEVRKGFFDQVAEQGEVVDEDEEEEDRGAMPGDSDEDDVMGFGDDLGGADGDVGGGWGGDDGLGLGGDEGAAAGGGGGWGDMDLDLGLGDDADGMGDLGGNDDGDGEDIFIMPRHGKSAQQMWADNSPLAADNVAAGLFDQAMHLLSRQIGAVNFEPLKQSFLDIHQGASCLITQLPGTAALEAPLQRSNTEGSELPELMHTLSHCVDLLKRGYQATTMGKIPVALSAFTAILHTLPLVVVDKEAQQNEVAELLGICREYITAMRIETTRREAAGNPLRQVALAAYFTQCNVQPKHLMLGLRQAITAGYKSQNFKLTAGMCRRSLELYQSAGRAALGNIINVNKIKKVLQQCEVTNEDKNPIDYDDSLAWTFCCETLEPIADASKAVKCPYCGSAYKAEFAGQVCKTCNLSKIGAQATGLRNFL